MLLGYGFIRVFKIVAPDGDIDYWATNDLQMSPRQRQQWAEFEWSIEEYHRGKEQWCGVEKAQVLSGACSTLCTLVWRFEPFYAWRCIGLIRALVGMSPNSALFGRQCAPT